MNPTMNPDYLILVIEEAAEVIHAASKILRFGSLKRVPVGGVPVKEKLDNTQLLAREVGDLQEVLQRLALDPKEVEKGRRKKWKKLEKWGPQGRASMQAEKEENNAKRR